MANRTVKIDGFMRAKHMPKIQPSEIYHHAVRRMKPEDIDHHGNGNGIDDLYLKCNDISDELVARLTCTSLLSTFISPIDGSRWYELPFCYPVIEEEW